MRVTEDPRQKLPELRPDGGNVSDALAYFPGCAPCELCSEGLGRVPFEGLLLCLECSQSLRRPTLTRLSAATPMRTLSLEEAIALLIRERRC